MTTSAVYSNMFGKVQSIMKLIIIIINDNKDAKDNVRCIRKREKIRGNHTWRDVKNAAYNEKYSNKMDEMKREWLVSGRLVCFLGIWCTIKVSFSLLVYWSYKN